jgi:hypothetical protein
VRVHGTVPGCGSPPVGGAQLGQAGVPRAGAGELRPSHGLGRHTASSKRAGLYGLGQDAR